ncbi:MAG: hypothetical protein WC272_11645 [Sulfurimonas sp.]|jgi:hypothetical protein
MKKIAKLLLLLLLSIAPLSAKEKLLDMNSFELVPPPKENSFQKYQLNDNIIFGTDMPKTVAKDGSFSYRRDDKTTLTFELLQDDSFTILEDVYLGSCCNWFYLQASDDFGNSVYYKMKNSLGDIDGFVIVGNDQEKKVQLKIAKEEGKRLSFYIDNKLVEINDSEKLANLDRIQYIKIFFCRQTITNFFVFKD